MAGDVKNFPGGKPVVILGTDGTDLYGITVDTSGHLQVDVLTIPAVTGGATEVTLAAVLAELLQKLETADLNIEAVSKDLQVDVKTSGLPTGAATAANQAAILAKLDVALSTRALETGGNLAAILAKDDVARSTRALETGGNLAAAATSLALIDDFALGTNKIFGYNAIYEERLFTLDAVVGSNNLNGSVVPAGEIWIVQGVAISNANSAAGAWRAQVRGASAILQILYKATPAAGVTEHWTGSIVLNAGAFIRATFAACVAGDDIYLDVWGYKMKIA